MFRGIIKNTAYRSIGMSHHTFHTISSANKMTFINPFDTTGTYKNIFIVIGHSHHFVRNYLSD